VDSHAWQGPNPRKFTYWSHLVAMLFGQWSPRKSLRDVVFSGNRQAHKLYHPGLAELKRSTLADANQQRPAIIFEKTYFKLYERFCWRGSSSRPRRAGDFWNSLTCPNHALGTKIYTEDNLCYYVSRNKNWRPRHGLSID
jgi:hypothetical protein